MKKIIKRSAIALAVCSGLGLVSASAIAGNNDGVLRGTVVDSQNTMVAGATITIKNKQTGFTRTVTADDQGSYRFPSLPVGNYVITVSKDGFQPQTVDSIVRIGENTMSVPLYAAGMERIEVRGSSIAMVDVSSSETALNISAVELDRIPVPRSVTSVALLAPGTTRGDSRFGSTASFGGASVAENTMYINGLNVTNFRNGLGFSTVPYDFYDQFQVKTGGYSAEFGRSTGGVINAVVKSGSNEFKAGASVYFEPSGLRETSPSVRKTDGTWLTYRDDNTSSTTNVNVWASGALVEDKLFFYALYNPRSEGSVVDSRQAGKEKSDGSTDNAFWGVKLDWNITEDHRLELLTFSDKSTYDSDILAAEGGTDTTWDYSGGQNWSLKYVGYLTEDLTVSALYGENKYDRTSDSASAQTCQLVLDYRVYYGADTDIPINALNTGCSTTSTYFVEKGDDQRKAARLDFEWALGEAHTVRFGLDNEVNTSYSEQAYTGPNGAYWIAYPGSLYGVEGDVIRSRVRTVIGEFETQASAMYIEDTWTVNDQLTLNLGVRNEAFDNKNGSGNSFAKIDNMIAPRIGVSYDLNGDGESKVFANVGRYFLPVASNTNIRLSGNESDIREWYILEGWTEHQFGGSTYWEPILGENYRHQPIADGVEPDTRSIVADNLDPMYQDEIIIGYEAMINDQWSWGIKYTNREMKGAIDDMIIDHAYNCGDDYHPHQYVLGNPGQDMRVYGDSDCDGEPDAWMTFSAQSLKYDEAVRKYHAVDLNVKKQWDNVWSLSATYTWSHSYGNAEGMVKSDNGQTDAGLTTDWDFPELMDGAYGDLPNDRRHMFKVFGTYAVTEQLSIGANFNLESGRPQNGFGLGHPDMPAGNNYELDYGSGYYVAKDTGEVDADGNAIYDWTQISRGSMGRLPWVARLDLNLMYQTEIAGLDTKFKVDVFNVLNAQTYTRVDEDLEVTVGNPNSLTYGRPLSFQTPRYVQVGVSVTF